MDFKKVVFPFGKDMLELKLPSRNLLRVIKAKEPKGVLKEGMEIKKSLLNPINALPISQTIKPHSKIVILISDVTRPVPTYKILPHILDEVFKVPVEVNDITIVVATGLHRENTINEIRSMVGDEVAEKFKVINHDAQDGESLSRIGNTSRGTPLKVNSTVADADVIIATGYIEPHEFAGFTGGRKSILPGVSGIESITLNHSIEMLSHPKARIGILKENPIHQEMMEAGEMVGLDFIVNVVLNSNREIAKVVSGDLNEAHLKGVGFLEDFSSVEVKQKGDIVITSSGHPLDLNFYQSVKSLVTAESFVNEGGEIILLSECSEGFGPPRFEECIMSSSSPGDLMKHTQKDYRGDIDHCLFLSRILKKCDVTIVTNNSAVRTINKELMGTATSMSDALNDALERNGRGATIIGLPYAQRIIPK